MGIIYNPTTTNVDSKAITWKSSKAAVASISSNGTVKGIENGVVIITGTYTNKERVSSSSPVKEKVSATCNVTITTPVSSLKLNKSSITLNKGKKTTMKATILPSLHLIKE